VTKNVKPLPVTLNDANYIERLRSVLEVRSMFLTDHAKKRMRERKVSNSQIIQCLEKGTIDEPAHLTIHGDWSATLGYFTGGDYVKVSTAISKDNKGELIVVITVIV